MDELKRLNNNQYAYLRRLPIGKLLELLDIAPVPASCSEDEAYVEALEEAIIEKENENPTGFFPDVDQQWEQFVTHYLPDQGDTALEPERTEHAVSAQINHQSFLVPQKRVVRFKRLCRTALVAAVAIACMFAVMVTAQATGVDVFGAMARWTEDVFSFGQIVPNSQVSNSPIQETIGQSAKVPNIGFDSLQEAFDAYGMTEVHEPTWLPERYTLDDVDVLAMDDPFLRTFSASYTDGEGRVSISIISYEGEPATQVQKIGGLVGSKVKDGITFYLIQNTENNTIAWHTDQYEYFLASKEGTDILLKITESMFT